MPTVLIQFPAGRYHATPWGHHVNEGMVEWPPSPWRLMRSLAAVGYTSGLWSKDGPSGTGRSLLEKLSEQPPGYSLPPAVGAHTRHYMPVGTVDGQGLPVRTLVLDTWAHLDGNGVLAVHWDVALTEEETELLAALVERLGYLGRSESWVMARMLGQDEVLPAGTPCFPSDDPPPPGWEHVSFLAPMPCSHYAQWRSAGIERAIGAMTAALAEKQKKPTKKQREKEQEPYPADLIACLQQETGHWRSHGWSQPPGSRRLLYHRPANALETCAPKPSAPHRAVRPVAAMLLALATQSGNHRALPPVTQTLPQGELLHIALCGYINSRCLSLPLLIGRDEARVPLKGPHQHAHILHLDLDGDGHLDHVLIWAPAGLDGTAQEVIRALRQNSLKGGLEPVRLAVVGGGTLNDLRELPGSYGERLQAMLGSVGGSKEWISQTPFVAPRYLKKNGRNTLAGQVAAELSSRGLPPPEEIEVLPAGHPLELARHRHFVRQRSKEPPPADFSYSLRLRFATPIEGPLCLGYAGHFGLGLFRSIDPQPLA